MLQLKKTSSKKNIIYAVVLVVLFIGTGIVIYNTFFKGQSSNTASSDLINTEKKVEEIIKSVDSFNESELSFLSSKKFKDLRDNFSEIKIDKTGNKDLFFVPKEESKSKR